MTGMHLNEYVILLWYWSKPSKYVTILKMPQGCDSHTTNCIYKYKQTHTGVWLLWRLHATKHRNLKNEYKNKFLFVQSADIVIGIYVYVIYEVILSLFNQTRVRIYHAAQIIFRLLRRAWKMLKKTCRRRRLRYIFFGFRIENCRSSNEHFIVLYRFYVVRKKWKLFPSFFELKKMSKRCQRSNSIERTLSIHVHPNGLVF